jgi:hypothetical protein
MIIEGQNWWVIWYHDIYPIEDLPDYYGKCLQHFIISPSMSEDPDFSTFSSALVFFVYLRGYELLCFSDG